MVKNYKRLLEKKRFLSQSEEFLSQEQIREISFEIYINQRKLVTLSCIPGHLEELAFGYLYSESIILSDYEIKSYEFIKDDDAIYFECDIPFERINNFKMAKEKSNTCPVNFRKVKNMFDRVVLNRAYLREWMSDFLSDLDQKGICSCIYRAAVVNDNKINRKSIDFSVFNAIDKVAGSYFMEKSSPRSSFLIINGCISSEIVKKAVRLGIPLIISYYDPTTEAVRLAWDNKIFIISYSRNHDFDLYTGFNDIEII